MIMFINYYLERIDYNKEIVQKVLDFCQENGYTGIKYRTVNNIHCSRISNKTLILRDVGCDLDDNIICYFIGEEGRMKHD